MSRQTELLANIHKVVHHVPARQVHKFYNRALRFGPKQHQHNLSIEGLYHQLLKKIKNKYSTLPSETDRTVFEINRKYDLTSVVRMHDFVASSMEWSLECDVWGFYYIYYAFGNCPFEKEIRKMIELVASRLKVTVIKDFNIYYKAVISCQGKEFITVLNHLEKA